MNDKDLGDSTRKAIAKPNLQAASATQNVGRRKKSCRPHLYFWLCAAVFCLVFWVPLRTLITFSLTHDYVSHVLLIAPISVFLIYLKRQGIFSVQIDLNRKKTIMAGSSMFLLGLILLLSSKYQPLKTQKLSLEILSLVVLWISVFTFCYGTQSLRKARFPLLFLLLLV